MEQKSNLQMKNLNLECIKINRIVFYLVAAVSVTILFYCFRGGVSGNDFWWHVKAGEWICKNHVVPESDIFSWYGMERAVPWIAHEWLAEVFFFFLFSHFGEIGIYILSLAFAFIFLMCLLVIGKPYVKKNPVIGGIFFAILPVIVSMFFYGRPQIFGFLFLLIELWCLYQFEENPESRAIYFLPVLACLWSNMHGGSSCMSYLLCIVFLTAGICRFQIGRIYAGRWKRKSLFKLLAVTILVVLGLLINPIGRNVLVYPYLNLSDSLSMSMISEWAAPSVRNISHLVLFFSPLLLMAAGFLIVEARIRLIDLLIMGMFTFLLLRSQRFAILFDVAAVFCAFRYMPTVKIADLKSRAEYCVLGGAFAVTLIIGAVSIAAIAQTASEHKPMISRELSEEMLQYVKEQKPQRLFNDYNYGGELIYNEIPVFWDGRADLYAAEHMMENGISLMYLKADNKSGDTICFDVEQMILSYGFDAFLLLRERPLCAYLVSHPERYRAVYYDKDAIFFVPLH